MKKIMTIFLLVLTLTSLATGCTNQKAEKEQAAQTTGIVNPWTDQNSIEEAESATGIAYELPEVIANGFTADIIRTMNNELIEVVYYKGDIKICVRKQKGEGQDISGDYNQYETCSEESENQGTFTVYQNSDNKATKLILSHNGYSWSIVAPNGFGEASYLDIVAKIFES